MLAGVKCQHCGNLKRSLNIIGKDMCPSSFMLHLFFLFPHALLCVFMFLTVSSFPECDFDALCASCEYFTSIYNHISTFSELDGNHVVWMTLGWTKRCFCMLHKSPARFTLVYWLLITATVCIQHLSPIVVEVLYSLPATSSDVL